MSVNVDRAFVLDADVSCLMLAACSRCLVMISKASSNIVGVRSSSGVGLGERGMIMEALRSYVIVVSMFKDGGCA